MGSEEEEALSFHKENTGKISIKSKVSVKNKDDLSLAYTPGVAIPCLRIQEDKDAAYTYTNKGNSVAVVSDGSAVLGLGDIGEVASLPVMEGKCVLFKEFGGVDAYPILISTRNVEEAVSVIKNISAGFGGINLEDIAAPRCFEIEEKLIDELDIPVFHDDQHGSAIAVLAAFINSLKLASKKIGDVKVVVVGAGAAGIATSKLLIKSGVKKLLLIDSKGIVSTQRSDINKYKKEIAEAMNITQSGGLVDAIKGADVFIGLSKPGLLTSEMIKSMNDKPIVFAMANPTPEIMPDVAKEAGVYIMATGRSDFENQINNSLVFPGLFRGALNVRASAVNEEMKLAAANALAGAVDELSVDKILPGQFDSGVAEAVTDAVKKKAVETGVARKP
ncbi:NADP-dependent malic enzyme [Candidatus Woesearchaeota archaeon]|nr:NADP-dependent malic enzyme [Candidatus Woesearchaeota archaeon]